MRISSINSLGICFALVLSVVLHKNIYAQQIPVFSQYYDQPVLINPAQAGMKDSYQVFMLFRKQWTGIPDSPENQVLSFDGKPSDNVGIGLRLMNDRTDILRNTSFNFTYNYMIRINEESQLNLALNAGVVQQAIDFDKINVNDRDDEVILSNAQTQLAPDFNVGLLYVYKGLEVGFSSFNLVENTSEFSSESEFKEMNLDMIRHYNISLAYQWQFAEDWEFKPILVARAVEGSNFQYDVNAFFRYDESYWAGLTYRSNSSVNLSIGADLFGNFGFGYTHEFPINEMMENTGGSHEIQASWRFGQGSNKKKKKAENRKIQELKEENRMQYEQIDQLDQRIEQLQKEIEKRENKKENASAISQETAKEELLTLQKELEQAEAFRTELLDSDSAVVLSPQDAESLKKELIANRSLIKAQSLEIDGLREEVKSFRKELDELKNQMQQKTQAVQNTSDPLGGVKSSVMDNTEEFDYHVVLGAYKTIDGAKKYQTMLSRDKQLSTTIIQSDDKSFYFVCTQQTNNLDAALKELENKYDPTYEINGNPWVYSKEK